MRLPSVLPVALVFASLLGCSNNTPTTTTTTPAAPQAQVVGVSGTHLTLNGANWLPRGVTMQVLVRPAAQMMSSSNQNLVNALNAYNSAELTAITAFGADTLRFQISQPALDPASSLYDSTYLNQVITDVKLARSAGFIVMLMMQDEVVTGTTTPGVGPQNNLPLATAQTQSDWDQLNSTFASDQGVLYELFNEPHILPTAANWSLWLNGDTAGTSTVAPNALGMQPLINHLRAAGSLNVYVLDGLQFAKTLNGLPAVTDPLNRLVYAVHPYLDGSGDESSWDADFGIPSQTIPVWADEWSANTGQMLGFYNPPTPPPSTYQPAVDFLNYLRAHSIPLCSGAFDIPLFIVQTVPNGPYTNYDNFNPTVVGGGDGQLAHVLYLTSYGRALTLADGL